MFRDAATLDSERVAAKVRQLQAHWESSENWFDGSVDSIDKRLAQCNKLIGQCRAASVRLISRPESIHYIRLAHDLESDQRALTDMRHDLLYAASDREALIKRKDDEDWPGVMGGYTEHDRGVDITGGLHNSPGLHSDEDLMTAWMAREGKQPDLNSAREYWDHPHRHEMGRGRHELEHLSSKVRRWIELESRNFVADNEDAADDLHELTTRAANFAELKTSALSPSESRAIVAGFVGRVEELGRKAPRKTAAVATTTFEDFPAELMY